jgi:hypothetical protein
MKLMLRQSCCLLLKVCTLSNVSATNDLESLVFLTIKHNIDNVLVHPFLAWPYHLGLACMVLMSKGKNSMLLLAFDTTIQPKIRWSMHKLGLEVIGGLVAFRSPGSCPNLLFVGRMSYSFIFMKDRLALHPRRQKIKVTYGTSIGQIWAFYLAT